MQTIFSDYFKIYVPDSDDALFRNTGVRKWQGKTMLVFIVIGLKIQLPSELQAAILFYCSAWLIFSNFENLIHVHQAWNLARNYVDLPDGQVPSYKDVGTFV